MHSVEMGVHLDGEIPKVKVFVYESFMTVDICFDKNKVNFFFDDKQELINFKNNFLWAFEKPTKM